MHATDTVEMKKHKPRTEAQKKLRRERRAADKPVHESMTPEEVLEHQRPRRNEMGRRAYRLDTQGKRRQKQIEKCAELRAEKQEAERKAKIAFRRKQLADQAKTIPTGFCNCPHCFNRILVYGDKQKNIPVANKTTSRISIVIEHSGVTVNVPEIEKRPCATCIRDLWHFKQYGKYPRGSIFWELNLFDKGLR